MKKIKTYYTTYFDNNLQLIVFYFFLIATFGTILNYFFSSYFLGAFWGPSSTDHFTDFWDPVKTLANSQSCFGDKYETSNGSYPPLCRFVFYIFSRILPFEDRSNTLPLIRNHTSSMIILMFYDLICIFFSSRIVKHFSSGNKYSTFMMNVLLLFSTPMIFIIERGNIIHLTFVLCFFFSLTYNSDNKVIRHISYIALSIAAALKIYPAILGLILFKGKHKKEIVTCIVIGFHLLLIPFLLMGGFEVLVRYINNIGVSVNNRLDQSMFSAARVNFSNIIMGLAIDFGFTELNGLNFNNFIKYPVYLLLFLETILSKSEWKAWISLILLLCFIPGFSIFYMTIFYIIPIYKLFFKKNISKEEMVYFILLFLIIAPFQFMCGKLGIPKEFFWSLNGRLELVLAFLLCIDCLKIIFSFIKEKIKKWSDRNEEFCLYRS